MSAAAAAFIESSRAGIETPATPQFGAVIMFGALAMVGPLIAPTTVPAPAFKSSYSYIIVLLRQRTEDADQGRDDAQGLGADRQYGQALRPLGFHGIHRRAL